MQLYFVRHGLAEDREVWYPRDDYDRPLTAKGVRKMERSAAAMAALGIQPALILTSPLVRARQTADIVAEALGCQVVDSYLLGGQLDAESLGNVIGDYEHFDALMLVGHEPDFSDTVGELIGDAQVVVKKGSLIRVDLLAWYPLRGELVWNIPPKLLAMVGE